MPTVISVQKFSIPLVAGQLINSATLAVGTVVANCVPFMNGRVVTPTADPRWLYNAVHPYFSGNTIVVETTSGATRELLLEVTVVEFDPAAVKVQQISYQILNTFISTTAPIASVILANTFAVHGYMKTSTSRNNVDSAIELSFASTTQLALDREGFNGDITGTAYVMEAIAGAFTVQTITTVLTAPDVTETIPVAVTMNKTLIVSSYKSNSGTGSSGTLVPYIQLLSPTQLLLSRIGTSGGITAKTFVVSFAAGGAEVVQRGLLTQTVIGGTISEDVAIAQVDLTRAMAWITASMSFRCGRIGGVGVTGIPDSRMGVTFPSNVLLRFQRSIFHATPLVGTDNRYSWEVIEWGMSAAPPSARRVMVVT